MAQAFTFTTQYPGHGSCQGSLVDGFLRGNIGTENPDAAFLSSLKACDKFATSKKAHGAKRRWQLLRCRRQWR